MAVCKKRSRPIWQNAGWTTLLVGADHSLFDDDTQGADVAKRNSSCPTQNTRNNG